MKEKIVGDFMTRTPSVVVCGSPVAEASRCMKEHGFRHLPVVNERGEVVGIVSHRDLREYGTTPVEQVMTPAPYLVYADAPLRTVIQTMAKEKYGCAVVVDQKGTALGILTAVDALHLLVEMLGDELWRNEARERFRVAGMEM